MISLCTAFIEGMEEYLPILLESILNRTKLVSEVVVSMNDQPADYYEETVADRGVVIKKIGWPHAHKRTAFDPGNQHALGLHNAIERSTRDHLLFCDLDVFFYSAAEEVYLRLMEKHNLQACGCSSHAAVQIATTFFPWHGQVLVKRADLPDQDFLKGKIWMTCGDGDSEGKPCKTRFDGKYLQMFAIEGLTEMFPNPEGGFDTASYLWLWAHQQQWRWFAFQTIDCHHYTTRYSRNNCKIIEKLPAQDLIYHRVSGGILDIAPFTEAYALSKEDE